MPATQMQAAVNLTGAVGNNVLSAKLCRFPAVPGYAQLVRPTWQLWEHVGSAANQLFAAGGIFASEGIKKRRMKFHGRSHTPRKSSNFGSANGS